MITATFAQLVEQFATGTDYVGEFAADLDIPVLTGPQCQGDVSIAPRHLLPATVWTTGDAQAVTGRGIEVIRGGAMNNAHTLRTLDQGVLWQPAEGDEQVALGVLTVPDEATCFLEHPEHGFNGIGAGTFVIGRQREQADVVRMVAD